MKAVRCAKCISIEGGLEGSEHVLAYSSRAPSTMGFLLLSTVCARQERERCIRRSHGRGQVRFNEPHGTIVFQEDVAELHIIVYSIPSVRNTFR
jgi:hypothetical protein